MKNRGFGWLRMGLAALVLGLSAPQPASADIRAFNAAVQRRDYAEAAAEAERTWPTLDKTRTDIAVIAREFGAISMLGGQPAKARVYATFLVDGAASLPAPDESPELSRVLLAWANQKIRDTQSNRRALNAALTARLQSTGYDTISLLAASEASKATFRAADWDDARVATNAALDLSRRAGRSMLAQQRNSELALIAIDYVDSRGRNRAVYGKAVDFDEQVFADARDPANAAIANELWLIHDYAWAWRNSMQAYFRSGGTPNVREREVEHDEDIQHRGIAVAPNPPYCWLRRTDTDARIDFPERSIFSGTVGAVIVDVQVGDDLKAANARIVAAVPSETFSAAVLRGAQSWRFERIQTPDAPGEGCRIARDHHPVVVQFVIP